MNKAVLISQVDLLQKALRLSEPTYPALAESIGIEIVGEEFHSSGADLEATRSVNEYYFVEPALFVEALKELPERIPESLSRTLAGVGATIECRLLLHMGLDPKADNDEFYKLLDQLGSLSDQFSRLSLHEEAANLTTLHRWIKMQCGREYSMAVDASIYLSAFGPHACDEQMPPETVRVLWDKAYDCLVSMKANAHASELFEETKSLLIQQGDEIVQRLSTGATDNSDNAVRVRQEIAAVLSDIRNVRFR